MEQLTKHIKESRAAELSTITEEIRREYLKQQIGKTVEVLFEVSKDGYTEGYTKNYTPVRVFTQENYQGEIKQVTIKNAVNDYCEGEII